MNSCPRCLGQIVAGSCLQCGYEPVRTSDLPLMRGHSVRDYAGVKREWRRGPALVSKRRPEDFEIIEREKVRRRLRG